MMNKNLPIRKATRLKEYDYSQNGAYFITVCTHNKEKILCDIVGDGVYDIPKSLLTTYGNIIDKYIIKMNNDLKDVTVDKYVIMPNHIHLILKVHNNAGCRQAPSPTNATIPKFMSLFKRYCNREIGYNIFQRSFHDHIIRDYTDYLKIWQYIDTNPAKWQEDCFYTE